MNVFNPVLYRGADDTFLPSYKSDLLFMHPSSMESCDFKKGSSIIATTQNGYLLFKCWPLDTLCQTDVSLPAFSLLENYTNSTFALKPFNGLSLQADRVVLSPIRYDAMLSHYSNSRRFIGFLKEKLDKLHISEGMVIKFEYLLSPCLFRIKRIISFNNHDKDKSDKELHDASLTDSIDSSFILENSFEEKCNISRSVKSGNRFQSSTPVSSPITSSHKKQSYVEPLKLCADKKAFLDDIDSEHFYCVHSKTHFIIEDSDHMHKRMSKMSIENIGGLNAELYQITSTIESLLNSGTKHVSRGMLVIGPQGAGKSMIINALQQKYKYLISMHVVNRFTFVSDPVTLSNEQEIIRVQRIFKDAVDEAPSIIFLDDIDKICKNGNQGNVNKTLKNELPVMIHDLLDSTTNVLVIATCESESSAHNNLRKQGFLDKEIKLPIPSPADRKQILSKIARRHKNNLSDSQISDISAMTHGFVGRDLDKLFHKAVLSQCKQRKLSEVSFEHLTESLKHVKPKSVAEFSFQRPNVKWDDIGGMEKIKATIKEMVEWPLKYPEKLRRFKILVPRGLLMYGPPGCCKTMIVKALATESHLNFMNVNSSCIFNKYVGDSEKSVAELFKKARSAAPCILFFDEIDSLAPKRGSSNEKSNVAHRVLTQMLIEIDGIDVLNQGVYVVAATNRPDSIDPSLLRPGRFDRMIYVPLPDSGTRRKIFEVTLKRKPVSPEFNFQTDLSYLVEKTENYTGAEISGICNEACMLAIREDSNSSTSVLTMAHFLEALMSVQPRTTKEMIESFEHYNEKNKF